MLAVTAWRSFGSVVCRLLQAMWRQIRLAGSRWDWWRRAEAPDELERRELGGLPRWLAEGLTGGSDPGDLVRPGGDVDAA